MVETCVFDNEYVLVFNECNLHEINILPEVLIHIVFDYYNDVFRQVWITFKHTHIMSNDIEMTATYDHLLTVQNGYNVKYLFNTILKDMDNISFPVFDWSFCNYRYFGGIHTYALYRKESILFYENSIDCGSITFNDDDLVLITCFIKTVHMLYSRFINNDKSKSLKYNVQD